MNGSDQRSGATRRALLGGAASLGVGATAGCVQRLQDLMSQRQTQRLRLSIKCVPTDSDPVATQLARRLTMALEAAGAAVQLELQSPRELRRDVLIDQDFDIYVGRFPGGADPDYLHSMLHSIYYNNPGWQNPFGFTDLELDELLDTQRRQSGAARRDTVAEILRSVARQQPFTTLAVPDDIAALRADSYDGFSQHHVQSPLRYLSLSLPEAGIDDPTLGLATTDASVTRNLNPLAVAEGDRQSILGLLYEPLGRRVDGRIIPWLAKDWRYDSPDPTVAEVTLREGLTWHDGVEITAEDVVFTFQFMADTSMGRLDSPVPAPPYHGRSTLVKLVEATDPRTIRFDFGEISRPVSKRALQIPILPAHIWSEKTGPAELAGINLFDGAVEALVWPNMEPVGSGPLQFEAVSQRTSLTLVRNDDHFIIDDGTGVVDRFDIPYPELSLQVAPSDHAAVALAAGDDVDATATPLSPGVVREIGRQSSLYLQISRSKDVYHIGYNARHPSLGNPHFRRVVARLLDETALVDELLEGYGTPTATPLANTEWVPSSLVWENEDPNLPYLGSDGQLDETAVRDALRAAGYEYDGDGHLLAR